MDEFRRRQSMSDSSDKERAFLASKKRKWKKTQGRWCDQCKATTHNTDKCWVLHPSLRPKRLGTAGRVNKSTGRVIKVPHPKVIKSKKEEAMITNTTEPKEEAMVAISSNHKEESNSLVNQTEESNSLLDLDFDIGFDDGPDLDTIIPEELVNNKANLVNDQSIPLMDIDKVITLTTTNNDYLRITKSSLLDLINQIESAKVAIQ